MDMIQAMIKELQDKFLKELNEGKLTEAELKRKYAILFPNEGSKK